MKSILKETLKSEYPCLKINRDMEVVVLFTYAGWGVVINSLNSDFCLGYTYSFKELSFTTFNGTVTLEN